jgi:hypothetical protein
LLEQPLTLREPEAPAAEVTREAEAPRPEIEAQPAPRAAIPPVQRQAVAEELPLRAPVPPIEPDLPVKPEPPTPAPKPVIQRRASLDVPQEPLPLREAAEPARPIQASEQPEVAAPPARPARNEAATRPPSPVQRAELPKAEAIEPPAPPPAKIQRQTEGGDGQPRARLADMPLREPPAGPSEPAARDLGDQVYARIVQGANLSHLDMPATGTRPVAQRKAGNGHAPLPLAERPQPRGLARSSPASTPVLPQARIQREVEPAPGATRQDSGSPLWPSPTTTSGTLPLAPPQVASASDARRAGITTTGVQSLPLAPTIQRHDAPESESTVTTRPRSNAISTGSTYTPPTTDDDDDDMGLVRLFEEDYVEDEIEEDTPLAPDTETTDGINLDELADKVMPYLKRLMKIERERYNPI